MRTRKHAEMTELQFGAQFAALLMVKPVVCLRAPSLAHYRRVVFPNPPYVSLVTILEIPKFSQSKH